ncbi:MAG: hypothetical protein ABWZ52_03145 [Acidimicrobiales bacterium]
MATATKPTTKATTTSKPANRSAKDPASLVKSYFNFRSTVLDKQEAFVLHAIERAPKSIKLPGGDRTAKLLKLPTIRKS